MYRFSRITLPAARPRGFTLQEMLVTLSISGSLATGGVAMWSTIQKNAVTAAANEIVAHLALARSEAIKRHTEVKLCPSRDHKTCLGPEGKHTPWQYGWLVYADENGNGEPEAGEIVRIHPGAPRDIVIRTSRARQAVTYQPIGTAGGSTITFAVCEARAATTPRYVIVSNSGRARVSAATNSAVKCA